MVPYMLVLWQCIQMNGRDIARASGAIADMTHKRSIGIINASKLNLWSVSSIPCLPPMSKR
jgi:hypothetical protein